MQLRSVYLRLIGLLCLILLLPAAGTAQFWFQRAYGGPFDEEAFCAIETADGGFFICGYIETPFPTTLLDVTYLKVNAWGDTVWHNHISLRGNQIAYAVQELADGGFTMAGYTDEFDTLGRQAFLLRIDAQGDTLWTRSWGGYGDEYLRSLVFAPDSGLVAIGTVDSATTSSMYLLRASAMGDSLFERRYGGGAGPPGMGRGLVPLPDSGYAATGTLIVSPIDMDVWFLRLDENLDTLVSRRYREPDETVGNCIDRTSDGGFLIAGTRSDFGNVIVDMVVLRLDSLGDTLWTRKFGGPGTDKGIALRATPDGGSIVVGFRTLLAIPSDLWLHKLDAQGGVQWSRIFGGISFDYANSVQLVSDGGYIIAGNTGSFSAGDGHFYVIRLDSSGIVGVVEEPSVGVTVYPNPATHLVRFDLPQGAAVEGVQLWSLQGKLLLRGGAVTDVSGLARGVYVYRVWAGDRVYVGRLVKE